MKILVIDDEREILDAIEQILSKEGYEIEKSDNILEGKAKIKSEKYDLIISDIMLPFWGGFDLVDAVKENESNKKTPVLIITGMDKDILESTNTFADGCLPKPFTGKQLTEMVKSLVEL